MKHLLFLEDEEFQIEMIRGYYDRCPLHKIATAEFTQSPLAAMDRAKQGGIDYVILDMRLGNVSGYNVISNIARQPCKPKIWAYTAFPKETDIRNRFIDEYILKSRGVGYLFSKLEAVILKDEPIICELTLSS